ncbi:MAG TPA: lipid-binding protein [Paludibacter sp.]
MRKIKLLIMSLVAIAFYSCEPTYVKEYNWAYPVAGDWTLTAYTNGAVYGGPYEIKSYNSSFGKDSIWFDDYGTGVASAAQYGNFWTMKFKVAADVNAKTFSTVGSINRIPGYPINIVVTNGKIVGNDSITMDIVFEDDPTTTYQLAGHRTVSYEEYTQQ